MRTGLGASTSCHDGLRVKEDADQGPPPLEEDDDRDHKVGDEVQTTGDSGHSAQRRTTVVVQTCINDRRMV